MSTSTRRAHRRDLLAPTFLRASLGCKVLGGAIDPKNASIFQMDINNSRRFGEYFRIWPGARDNQVEVIALDRRIRQVVLRVKEARRPFTRQVRKWSGMQASRVEAQARAEGGRIIADYPDAWVLQLWTPGEERRFLCGMDDVRLFVAQVREASTVAEAHEFLKPWAVKEAERKWPGRIRRQGEWFFVPAGPQETSQLTAHVARSPGAVKRQRPVGSGLRPHLADEVARIDHRPEGRRRGRRETVYARGTVRHPDHRPLLLRRWRKVVRNREIGAAAEERLRLRWID